MGIAIIFVPVWLVWSRGEGGALLADVRPWTGFNLGLGLGGDVVED